MSIPKLTQTHMEQRMVVSLEYLVRYHENDYDFLFWIVTGVEQWVHHFTPDMKAASMEWKCPSSPIRKKFKTTPSTGEVLLTFFWQAQRVLLLYFLEVGTINGTRYCDSLSKFLEAIRKKRPGHLRSVILKLDDNARPLSVTATQNHFCNSWLRAPTPSAIQS